MVTKYLVLEKISAAKPDGSAVSNSWVEQAEIEAASARAAIRGYLGTNGAKGEYVAVPARSFKPVKVTVETQTKLTLS